MLRTLRTIFDTPWTIRFAGATWVLSFLALFLFVERSFFVNVATGDFPLWLFLKILPTIVIEFALSDLSMFAHYILIAFLIALYAILIRHMFVTMRYVSIRSLSVSVAGMFGITLGVACLSCSALAGLILASALGALSLPITLVHNSHLFLLVGEGLLVLSIILLLAAIRRIQ